MDLILVSVNPGKTKDTKLSLRLTEPSGNYVTPLNHVSASPHSHALLDVSWSHLVTQVHHKLGKLFDVDDVFGILRVCIDDLCASFRKK